jgi:glutathione S-transferase
MLRLHHDWDSFASFKVRICLAEKALPWDSHIVCLGRFEHLKPDFLALNPNGLVPALEHDSTVVVESSVILEYLEDAFPSPRLRPGNAAGKARMREWMQYSAGAIHQSVRPPTFHLMIKRRFAGLSPDAMKELVGNHPNPERAAAYREWACGAVDAVAVVEAMRSLRTAFRRMDRALGEAAWLAGRDFSLADIAVAPLADRVHHLGMDFLWDDCANVRRWIRDMTARPSYRLSAPPDGARLPRPSDDVVAQMRRRWQEHEIPG